MQQPPQRAHPALASPAAWGAWWTEAARALAGDLLGEASRRLELRGALAADEPHVRLRQWMAQHGLDPATTPMDAVIKALWEDRAAGQQVDVPAVAREWDCYVRAMTVHGYEQLQTWRVLDRDADALWRATCVLDNLFTQPRNHAAVPHNPLLAYLSGRMAMPVWPALEWLQSSPLSQLRAADACATARAETEALRCALRPPHRVLAQTLDGVARGFADAHRQLVHQQCVRLEQTLQSVRQTDVHFAATAGRVEVRLVAVPPLARAELEAMAGKWMEGSAPHAATLDAAAHLQSCLVAYRRTMAADTQALTLLRDDTTARAALVRWAEHRVRAALWRCAGQQARAYWTACVPEFFDWPPDAVAALQQNVEGDLAAFRAHEGDAERAAAEQGAPEPLARLQALAAKIDRYRLWCRVLQRVAEHKPRNWAACETLTQTEVARLPVAAAAEAAATGAELAAWLQSEVLPSALANVREDVCRAVEAQRLQMLRTLQTGIALQVDALHHRPREALPLPAPPAVPGAEADGQQVLALVDTDWCVPAERHAAFAALAGALATFSGTHMAPASSDAALAQAWKLRTERLRAIENAAQPLPWPQYVQAAWPWTLLYLLCHHAQLGATRE